MVTSGAVAFGKQKLAQELLMTLTMRETLHPKEDASHTLEPRAAAAVGKCPFLYSVAIIIIVEVIIIISYDNDFKLFM